ncbi:MAG: RluA family pseudouridine synthase, partial [Elusimicrobiota bacterium]|nr:RluA family pseudouridine synthase [Elusimicrobiota bacterium]
MRAIEKELKVVADSTATNKRIDSYLSEIYNDYSRAFFQGLIRNNYIVVNGKPVKPSYRVKSGDIIKISFPEISQSKVSKIAEKYLKIIYEDNSILVIDKPAGMCVHPTGARSWSRRIRSNEHAEGVRKARARVGERLGSRQDLTNLTIVDIIPANRIVGSVERSGIVHRLDKDTSGVMVIAKTPQAQFKLQKQFQNRQVEKTYLAIVHNSFSEKSGSISAPLTRDIRDKKKFHIGFGRDATTEFKVKKNFNNYAYLEIHPITGRTHQVRVHLSSIGHPILGDRLYSRCTENEQFGVNRQMLHSYKLKIVHPEKNKSMEFTADLPRDFLTVLRAIRKLTLVVLSVFLLNSFVGVFAQINSSSLDEQLKTEIKKLSSRIDHLKSQVNAISERLSEIQKQLKEHSEYQNRIKELNSAITELNRKLTVVESNFEDFKFSLKREKI